MTIYNATTKQSLFINSRETAPIKAVEDMYDGNSELSRLGMPNTSVLCFTLNGLFQSINK